MQHPMYSFIMAPLIYTLIKIMCDNAELYHSSDVISDTFRATYFDKEDTFDFIVGKITCCSEIFSLQCNTLFMSRFYSRCRFSWGSSGKSFGNEQLYGFVA